MKSGRTWPSLAGRLLIAVALSTLLAASAALALSRLAPSWTFGLSLLVVALLATPIVFVGCRFFIMRDARAAMLAVSDGLLSLTERDYSLRLAPGGPFEVAELKRRFNTLAASLRSDRNDIFQRQIMLETVLMGSTMAVVLVNEARRIVFCNEAARAVIGLGARVEGQDLDQLLAAAPEQLRTAAHASEDLIFTCDRPGHESETYRLMKRYFQLNTQTHTLYLFTPLTRELARKEVETWKKAIRVLSHEVNNSLAPISSLVHSARVMLKSGGHAERLQAALDTIEERASHLRVFLDGYGSFARLPLPSKKPLQWQTLLAGLEGLYPFRVEGAIPEKPLVADGAQLEQVLINLLKNASESGSDAQDIALVFPEAEASAPGHAFHVVDRGKGMTDEVLQNALLPFYSTKKAGTGLGLALCREIVEAHEGRLSLSLRPGGGVDVACWLP